MREGAIDPATVRRLYQKAAAERWRLAPDRFAAALESSVAKGVSGERTAAAVDRYLASLHVEDLALAAACADGNETAWDHFVLAHRPVLYRAADAIDRTGGAREIADSLYADLYGLSERDGTRLSLFRYFHGRSSLATWLRTVLAQRYVDRLRATRRLQPLPADDAAGESAAASVATAVTLSNEAPIRDRTRFVAVIQRAMKTAIGRLAPKDRLRLAMYYARDLTLAQIGRTLGEHEATSSRHLARTRRALREDVERQLRQEQGMSDAELDECFASVATDAGTMDLAELLGGRARKNPELDRST